MILALISLVLTGCTALFGPQLPTNASITIPCMYYGTLENVLGESSRIEWGSFELTNKSIIHRDSGEVYVNDTKGRKVCLVNPIEKWTWFASNECEKIHPTCNRGEFSIVVYDYYTPEGISVPCICDLEIK